MCSHASSHALSVTSRAFIHDEDEIHNDAPQPSVTSNAFVHDKDEIHDDAPQPPPSPPLPSTIGKSAEEFTNSLAHLQLYDDDNDDDVKEEELHDSKPPVSNPNPLLGLTLYNNDDEEDEIVLSRLPEVQASSRGCDLLSSSSLFTLPTHHAFRNCCIVATC